MQYPNVGHHHRYREVRRTLHVYEVSNQKAHRGYLNAVLLEFELGSLCKVNFKLSAHGTGHHGSRLVINYL